MIEAFIPTSVMELSTQLTDQPSTYQGAGLILLGTLCAFGAVSASLFIASFRHNHRTEGGTNPSSWQEHSPEPKHTFDRKIEPGNLSAWKEEKARMPKGPELN